MDWERVYDAYPVNEEMIWLNNCGTVPAGTHVVEAVARFLHGYARRGVLDREAPYPKVKREIKEILSGLLNCRPEELALIHNTSEGMNIISHGVDLAPGDEVILLENEYPSNVYPWRHLEQKGVVFRTAPMTGTPADFYEELKARITDRTRLAALSAVHWCTGMPLPIRAVGALCRKRGILLVVDGAQGVGMQPVDVREMGIDFMTVSAWKWLMGPLGLGVLFVEQSRLEHLHPAFVGTGSVVDDEAYLPYKTELKASADRFAISTPNFIDWIYFLAALRFQKEIGFPEVRGRIFHLAGHLIRELRRIGCRVVSDRFPDHPTGIVAFEKPGTPTLAVIRALKAEGIVSAERLGRVRLSPHIFNSPEQLDRAVRAVKGA